MTDLNRFKFALPVLLVMTVFAVLGWQSITIAASTVFFAIVFVVCMDELRAELRNRG